jgi:Domain of unknown function (DUF4062)
MTRVFISSTSEDLSTYRAAAREVCERQGMFPVAMEQFAAMSAGATAGSRSKLEGCDLYVGFYAYRYGYIEPGYDRSVTELEFDYASDKNIDRLCFVIDPQYDWPHREEENAGKLRDFKARVDRLIRARFGDINDFKFKLLHSLVEWEKQRNTLRISLRRVFDSLLDDHKIFGGRKDTFQKIDEFVSKPDGGYLVLTAPPGFGKTALLANLVRRTGGLAYHFFTSSYGTTEGADVRSERFFLRNVLQQIAPWRNHIADLPESVNELAALYYELLLNPFESPHLLVLDGLDEANTKMLTRYLKPELPANMHIVASVRDLGQDWRHDYSLPPKQTRELPLAGLTTEDVAEILRSAGSTAAEFAADPARLDAVMNIAAYPGNPDVGADPLYVRFLVHDIQDGVVTQQNIGTQPRHLDDYLDGWWNQMKAAAKGDEKKAAQDLLGILTVAVGPIGQQDLEAISAALAGDFTSIFDEVLGRMPRLVAGNHRSGFALAHPRLREYMRKKIHIQAFEQRVLDFCGAWRRNNSHYALAYYVRHLEAAGQLKQLYATVLDEDFHSAQAAAFGSVYTALADLRTVLHFALVADDLVSALKCAGMYRKLVRTEGLAKGIFSAVDSSDLPEALRRSANYGAGGKPSGAWAQVLRSYLLWEAAERGSVNTVRSMAAGFWRRTHTEFAEHTQDLSDALLVRAAKRLSGGVRAEALGWLGQLRTEGSSQLERIFDRFSSDAATPPARDDAAVAAVEASIQQLEHETQDDPEWVSQRQFINEEFSGQNTQRLREMLVHLAPDPQGQGYIDRALASTLTNPYPRYRDNALVALGVACVAVPDVGWARSRLRPIIEVGLDREGITFTFDLASHLAAEAAGRRRPAAGLESYLRDSLAARDRWGTHIRAHSAQASALFWRDRTQEALNELRQAVPMEGFAGFFVIHLLSLANRWKEFGLSHRAHELGLVEQARQQAARVLDPVFAWERGELVKNYDAWLARPPANSDDTLSALAGIADVDARRVYKDLASATWMSPPGAKVNELKELVSASLSDGTALDFIFARLFALRLREHRIGMRPFTDEELSDSIRVCEEQIAISRPWLWHVAVG